MSLIFIRFAEMGHLGGPLPLDRLRTFSQRFNCWWHHHHQPSRRTYCPPRLFQNLGRFRRNNGQPAFATSSPTALNILKRKYFLSHNLKCLALAKWEFQSTRLRIRSAASLGSFRNVTQQANNTNSCPPNPNNKTGLASSKISTAAATDEDRFDVGGDIRFGKTENIWTIPNALCMARIGMAPLVAYLIVNSQFGPAMGVFAIAGVTDLLDGWIARVVPGQSTVMGSFLDPMADKILVATLFLSLTYMGFIPVPLTGLIIGRDAILIMFGFYIRYQSLDPPKTLSRYFNVSYPTAQLAPTLISKINTGVQLGLVGATLVSTVLPYDVHPYLEALWYLTASTTIISAVGYCFAKDTVKLLRKHRGKLENRK